jgi:tetratricopeptide (TPR) repeat protein
MFFLGAPAELLLWQVRPFFFFHLSAIVLMHTKHLFLLLMILALFSNCGQPTTKQANNTASIPELLKRPKQIGPEGEMASMLELYDRMAGNIKANPKDVESKLTLIELLSIRPDIRSYSRVSCLREIYGQVDPAIEAMKLAVSAGYPGVEPTEWARLTLGNLYLRYGKVDSAIYHYKMALSARPNYPFAVAALARAEAQKGNQAEADKLINQACELIPEVSFYVDKAIWEKKKGNTDLAAKLTQDIMGMLADDIESGHKMGLEYVEVYLELLNDPTKALPFAMEEYTARPDNIDVNHALARVYKAMGNQTKAQEHFQKAMRTNSKNPELLALAQ